jgi:tetratricopeptide (TPR) repeat protein
VAEATQFKYRAFLSYSHRDKAWGKWLHAALEGYRIDKDLVGRETPAGPVPKTLRPIFRDREDFSAGHSLTEQTIAALEASKFLIVICSPNTAQSKYVNEEVRRFKILGRAERVIPMIVDGEPGDLARECFPPALRFKLRPDGQITEEYEEPIAADAREQGDGKEIAKQKVVAGLLGLGLDEIVRRAELAKKRYGRVRNSIISALFVLTVASAGGFAWARFELSRNEALLDRILQRATNLVGKATEISDRFGVPRSISVRMLEEAEGLFKDMAELGRETPQSRFRKASMLLEFARNYEMFGKTNKRREHVLEAHRLLQTLSAEDSSNLAWQNDLAVSYEAIGDVFLTEGNLNEALANYRAGLAIDERLVAADPTDEGHQRNLSLLHVRVGQVSKAQGKLDEALDSYLAALKITRGITNPARLEIWLRDVSVLEQRVGYVWQEKGNIDEALQYYRLSLDVSKVLADVEPTNSQSQQDLSRAHGVVGDALKAQGKFDEAVTSYRAGLAIADSLAATDTANAVWQHDLSGWHYRIGDLLAAESNLERVMASFIEGPLQHEHLTAAEGEKLAEALESYRASHTITERLVAADPTNIVWRDSFSMSYLRIGDVLIAQGKLDEAIASYRANFALRESLAAADPTNTDWQGELAISHIRIGVALQKQGKLTEALESYPQVTPSPNV